MNQFDGVGPVGVGSASEQPTAKRRSKGPRGPEAE